MLDINHYESCLSRTLDFIQNADSKANIQLTTNGILLAALSFSLLMADIGNVSLGLAILGALLSILSISFSINCVYPRLVPKKDATSKIYFDTAATLEQFYPGSLKDFFENCDEVQYRDELIGQIIVNASVAKKKYRLLQKSSWFLVLAAITTGLFISIGTVELHLGAFLP